MVRIVGKGFPAEGSFKFIWLHEEFLRYVHNTIHLSKHSRRKDAFHYNETFQQTKCYFFFLKFMCCSHLLLSDPSVLQKNKTNFCESRFQLFAQVAHLLVGNIFLTQAVCAKVHHWNAHFTTTKGGSERGQMLITPRAAGYNQKKVAVRY